jgi:hypothetical protein
MKAAQTPIVAPWAHVMLADRDEHLSQREADLGVRP